MAMVQQFVLRSDMLRTQASGLAGVVAAQILGADATRIMLMIQNNSVNQLLILPGATPTLTFGYEIIRANGPLILTYEQLGLDIGLNWIAIANLAATPFTLATMLLENHA